MAVLLLPERLAAQRLVRTSLTPEPPHTDPHPGTEPSLEPGVHRENTLGGI